MSQSISISDSELMDILDSEQKQILVDGVSDEHTRSMEPIEALGGNK